jgi:symplekin
MLIQRRPMIANRILSSVLSFNPLKLANSPMTPKNKVIIRSLERTTRALLLNVTRRNPDANLHARVNQYLDRIARMRTDVFDESNRKRPAPVEPTDGLDTAKRQRLGANVPNAAPVIPPLPPGPVSYRQLYTLHSDVNTANFDVQAFQDRESLYRILVPILHSVDEKKLGQALNIVRTRYLAKSEEATRNNASAVNGVSVDDDEEEYEPDFEPEDAEQIVNRLDSAPPDDEPGPASNAPLAPYKLPEAPPLTEQEAQRYGDMTIRRVFGMLSAVDDTPMKSKGSKGGFNRLAATTYDQEAWITVLCRLATRAAAGLDDPDGNIKSEYEVSKKGSFVLSETIRDSLFNYIMYDWRRRIDIAINWLNEEWYNDQLQIQAARKKAQETVNGDAASLPDPKGNYRRCALRLLDGMMAYIESSDKVLVRFISEIPELDTEILQRMRKMAEDPERVSLSIMVLQFLYMFRPPVREITVDVLEDMWRTNDRAKPQAKKLLSKWRPQALESENEVKTEIMNGSYEVQPVS